MIARRPLDLDFASSSGIKFAQYLNVPRPIGAVLSSRLASLAELGTVLGMEDLYDLLEVIAVDTYNQSLLTKKPD